MTRPIHYPCVFLMPGLLLLLIFHAPPLFAGETPDPAAANDGMVSHIYDLSCFHWNGPLSSRSTFPLVPLVLPGWEMADDDRVEGSDFERLEEEFIQDLLFHVIGGEYFERDGAGMTFLKDHHLCVRSEPAAQERIHAVLRYLSAVVNRTVRLEVECFGVPPGVPLSEDLEPVLPAMDEGSFSPVFTRSVAVPFSFSGDFIRIKDLSMPSDQASSSRVLSQWGVVISITILAWLVSLRYSSSCFSIILSISS